MSRTAFWAYPFFQTPVSDEGYISLYDARAALMCRFLNNEYFGVETDSEIEEQLNNPRTHTCTCEACICVHVSLDSEFGDTIYSPDLFASSTSSIYISSNDTTIGHQSDEETNISNTSESNFYQSDSDVFNLSFSSSVHIESTDEDHCILYNALQEPDDDTEGSTESVSLLKHAGGERTNSDESDSDCSQSLLKH